MQEKMFVKVHRVAAGRTSKFRCFVSQKVTTVHKIVSQISKPLQKDFKILITNKSIFDIIKNSVSRFN